MDRDPIDAEFTVISAPRRRWRVGFRPLPAGMDPVDAFAITMKRSLVFTFAVLTVAAGGSVVVELMAKSHHHPVESRSVPAPLWLRPNIQPGLWDGLKG